MGKRLALVVCGILFAVVFSFFVGKAEADIFDTNDYIFADQGNYWPWGDARNLRYQLWFSNDMLSDEGFSGKLTSISHFIAYDSKAASYDFDVYASNTAVEALTTDFDANHGSDKTLIFSGNAALPGSGSQFLINVNPVFIYNGKSNLLIDYVFKRFYGIGNDYGGPTWEAVNPNSDFLRVTSHADEGDVVYDWGALRTQLNATPVPEPISSTLFLLGAGALGLRKFRRKKA